MPNYTILRLLKLFKQCKCFDEKVTLIFYKRIRLEWIIYLLRLYVFYYSRFARDKPMTERFSSGDKTYLFWEKFWSFLVLFFTFFFIVISFVGNSVVISLYSVEFLQFLLATPLHWIHCKFYLFVCVQSASYLMYYIALFGTIFLCLSFYTSEPYP